jgi:hypothetical protein
MYDRYDPQLRVFFQDYDTNQDFDWSGGGSAPAASPMSSLAKIGAGNSSPEADSGSVASRGVLGAGSASQSAPSASAGGSGAGLGGSDIAGMGLQLLGAHMSDKAAKEEADRLDRVRQEDLVRSGRDRMDSMRQKATENAMVRRGQNQKGLDFLNGMVDDSRTQGMRRSFSDALLHHGGY